MLTYYDKLSQVFWVSENYTFHACAMQKIYNLNEKKLNREVAKNETTKQKADETMQLLASQLLLGALSVPSHPHRAFELDFDPEKEKQQRMSVLVGHAHHIPHRRTIIADVVGRNVLSQVYSELRPLYGALESDFDPLSLANKVKPVLKFIESNEKLAKYLTPLKKMVIFKLVQQLGTVYREFAIFDFGSVNGIDIQLVEFDCVCTCIFACVVVTFLNHVSL
jgi:translation initiation factor 3 subunit A